MDRGYLRPRRGRNKRYGPPPAIFSHRFQNVKDATLVHGKVQDSEYYAARISEGLKIAHGFGRASEIFRVGKIFEISDCITSHTGLCSPMPDSAPKSLPAVNVRVKPVVYVGPEPKRDHAGVAVAMTASAKREMSSASPEEVK